MLQTPFLTCPKCFHSFHASRQMACRHPSLDPCSCPFSLYDGVDAPSASVPPTPIITTSSCSNNQCGTVWSVSGSGGAVGTSAASATRCTVTIGGQSSNVVVRCHSGGALLQASIDSSESGKLMQHHHHQDGSGGSGLRHLTLGLDVRPADVPDPPSISTTVPSPSVPFSFLLPVVPSPVQQQSADSLKKLVMGSCNSNSTEDYGGDLQRLNLTKSSLQASGFYYEGLSWQEAAGLLKRTSVGTFLVRDSSDPRFLYSLSVQTERGATSVRIHYQRGHFRLDAEERIAHLMPAFESVVALVAYYVRQGESQRKEMVAVDGGSNNGARGQGQVWVDGSGKMYSPIRLNQSLRRNVLSLQHLCRLTINRRAGSGDHLATLPLPTSLRTFLADYPYQI